MGFLGGSIEQNLPAKQETQVRSLGWEDPLEKKMATHSSILTWEIPSQFSCSGRSQEDAQRPQAGKAPEEVQAVTLHPWAGLSMKLVF